MYRDSKTARQQEMHPVGRGRNGSDHLVVLALDGRLAALVRGLDGARTGVPVTTASLFRLGAASGTARRARGRRGGRRRFVRPGDLRGGRGFGRARARRGADEGRATRCAGRIAGCRGRTGGAQRATERGRLMCGKKAGERDRTRQQKRGNAKLGAKVLGMKWTRGNAWMGFAWVKGFRTNGRKPYLNRAAIR